MSVVVGEVIEIVVTLDGNYAVWGQTQNGQVGVVHCFQWSGEHPIPDELCAKVGDRLRVKVMRIITQPQGELPSDATFDGRIRIDFVGSARLVDTDEVWE